MEKKVALIGIIVQQADAVERINALLHEYRALIVGRMGIPRPEHGVCVISVVLEATANEINALSGKLGRVSGVLAKSIQTEKIIGDAI